MIYDQNYSAHGNKTTWESKARFDYISYIYRITTFDSTIDIFFQTLKLSIGVSNCSKTWGMKFYLKADKKK